MVVIAVTLIPFTDWKILGAYFTEAPVHGLSLIHI